MHRPFAAVVAAVVPVLLFAAPAPAAAPRADLAVQGKVTPPSALRTGAIVKVTVRNAGRKRAGGSSLALTLSKNARADRADIRIGTAKIKTVKARKRVVVRVRVKLPERIAPGRYRLIACADAAKKLRERSERNNCLVSKATVTIKAGGTPTGGSGTPSGGLPGTGSQPPATGGSTTPGGGTPGGDPGTNPGPGDPGTGPGDPGPGPGPGPGDPQPTDPNADKPLPPAPPSQPVPLAESAKQLYTGPTARQTGVQDGAIEERRIVVLSGRVLDAANKGLAGVKVTVLGHPELGQTLSQADGRYDLAINGGGPGVLSYEKDGYLPAQQTITTPWREYIAVDDKILLQRDDKTTQVDPNAANAPDLTVAQGSTETDAQGTRQATLLFPKGTDAKVRLADGTEKPLTGPLTVRATEYTASGTEAMPGTMPPSTGFTYAADFSIDQADAQGAVSVQFDTPIVNYTDNIIGAPVGSPVPTGSYDRARGVWKPEPNGRVIKVLSEAGGKAAVDIDGDGVADDAGKLAAIGISDAELARLSELYDAGKELWRVRLSHFSPWDHNWPYGPPPGAKRPKLKFYDDQSADPCLTGGSQIDCETQTLGESIPLTGLKYGLHYRSDRVPGTIADDELRIPITGATVPQNLKTAYLLVNIAGKYYTRVWTNHPGTTFPALAANITETIKWDGTDYWGNKVQGRPTAYVSLEYIYPEQYYASPDAFEASFAQFPTSTEVVGYRRSCGNSLTEYACGVSIVTRAQKTLGGWDAEGADRMGGWTLGIHHAFDPTDGTLHRGDGSVAEARALGARLQIYAGDGENFPGAEGKKATDANIDYQGDMDVAPDGTVYQYSAGGFFGNAGNAIRRIDPDDQTIHTIAGNGTKGDPQCDGGPALERVLGNEINAVAAGPDGSVYYAATGSNWPAGYICVIRDGKLIRLAGINDRTGTGGNGDNGPALDAKVSQPRDVGVGPDGLVYWTEDAQPANGYKAVVRRIDPDGTVRRIAGGGSDANKDEDLGAGEPALLHNLTNAPHIAWTSEGDLLITQPYDHRVVKVDRAGVLTRYAGTGVASSAVDYGVPAATARVGDPLNVATGPDGTVYIRTRDTNSGDDRVVTIGGDGTVQPLIGRNCNASNRYNPIDNEAAAGRCMASHAYGLGVAGDGSVFVTHGRQWILRTQPAYSGFGQGSVLISSSDGRELYEFTGTGRHLRTLDTLTGAVLFRFGYDVAGNLVTITDVNDRVTKIERGASGRATAVIAPGGQRTALYTDGAGWLSEVRNPLGEATKLYYGGGGLLTGLTDPRGGDHVFTYDAVGRLTSDRNPSGFTKTLSREAVEGGSKVTVRTTLGKETSYVRRTMDNGDEERITTEPGGAATRTVRQPDGTTTQTRPDGTTVSTVMAPDPRFGNAARYISEQTVETPGKRKRVLTTERSASLVDPQNPLSIRFLSESTTVNGKTFSSSYDGTQRQLEEDTAANRRSTSTLDAKGRVVEIDPDADKYEDSRVQYEYDAQGRLTKAKQVDDNDDALTAVSFTYDAQGRVATRTDGRNKTTSYTYDAADRLQTMTTPTGKVLRFGHDAAGVRTSLAMPGDGALHRFGRTSDGLDAGYDPPGEGELTRTYDGDRRLTSTKLVGGRTLDFDFDAANRPTAEHFAEGTVDFDFADETARIAKLSRLAPGGTPVEQIAYEYDGSLITRANWTGDAVGDFTYTYDAAHRLTKVDLTSGADTVSETLVRDNDGLLTKEGPFTLTRQGPSGAVSAISDGTLAVNLGFDALGRSAGRTVKVGGTTKYALTLERDAVDRVTKRTDVIDGTTTVTEYGYDDEGRITEVKRNGTVSERYAYDDHGNRTSKQIGELEPQVATFDARDRILTAGTVPYTTDADGFVTQRGSDTFTYSARGELLQAVVGGETISYGYDGLARRVSRTAGGKTEQYLYGDPADPYKVTAVRGTDGVLTTYLYDEAGLLHAAQRGGVRYSVAVDQVGTPVAVFDAAGTVVRRITTDTWGVRTTDTGTFDLPFGFAGGLYDPATQLVRFGLRDYDPASGRWMARDPARFQGGQANLYAYVGSDPVRLRDPSGLICLSASLYEGIGGGAEICINEKGVSSCVEAGIGVGGGLGIKSGDPAGRSGFYTSGEASLKWGPMGIGDGFEIDPCGQDSYKVSANAGPYSAEYSVSRDDKGELQGQFSHQASLNPEDYGAEALGSTEFKAEAKLAAKYCATTMDM